MLSGFDKIQLKIDLDHAIGKLLERNHTTIPHHDAVGVINVLLDGFSEEERDSLTFTEQTLTKFFTELPKGKEQCTEIASGIRSAGKSLQGLSQEILTQYKLNENNAHKLVGRFGVLEIDEINVLLRQARTCSDLDSSSTHSPYL
jgi:hypothetical protein